MEITKNMYYQYVDYVEENFTDYLYSKFYSGELTSVSQIKNAGLFIAIILRAVKDLHFGNQKLMSDASAYLQSDTFDIHVENSLIPAENYKKLLCSPEMFCEHIRNVTKTIDVHEYNEFE